MVALSSSTFSENPHSRARSIASICTDTSRRKSLNRIEMRLSIYENRIGLDSFSRDPIGYDGSPYNLYEFCNGKSLVAIDPSGMWYVYCRAVRDYPFLRHCDLRRECSPGEAIGPTGQTEIISCYPVQKSPSCRRGLGVPTSNPNCPKTCCNATDQDIEDCLGAYPSDNGEGECGSNCQSNTAERLGRCCLDSSWTPDIYGEPGSNRCLKWKQAGNPITGYYQVCEEWKYDEYGRLPKPPCSKWHTIRERVYHPKTGQPYWRERVVCVAWGAGWPGVSR